ncbi:MAG: ExbD/TolR family protein [Flavisolibacter sp.]
MPSVKIPRKSTATDMTPFVDVAFLILAFFMLATKFKPPEPVQITTPHSVSSDKLKEQDAVLIEFDSAGRVYFTMNTKRTSDVEPKRELITSMNNDQHLGLSPAEIENFVNSPTVGSPFTAVKQVFSIPKDQRGNLHQPGIPVDSTNNQLTTWIQHAISAFAGRHVNYMIKGDNNAKYPSFKGVIDALKKNEQLKYQLITDPEGVPPGTDEYVRRTTWKKT